jgi:hypothetical protein
MNTGQPCLSKLGTTRWIPYTLSSILVLMVTLLPLDETLPVPCYTTELPTGRD